MLMFINVDIFGVFYKINNDTFSTLNCVEGPLILRASLKSKLKYVVIYS